MSRDTHPDDVDVDPDPDPDDPYSSTVRAVVLHRHSEPPRPGLVPAPAPGPDQVLVEVALAALNPADLMLAAGAYPGGPPPVPYTIGQEAVGIVRAVGADADPALVGQRVWVRSRGTAAARIAVPTAWAVPVPPDVDDDQAAAIGIAGTTAWHALTRVLQVRPRDAVLVLGASGPVGRIAVQAARALGAGRVVAAARNADALRELQARGENGAHDVLILAADDPTAALAGLGASPGFQPFDAVVDPVHGPVGAAALGLLRPGGRSVVLGLSAGPVAPYGPDLIGRGLTVTGLNGAITSPQDIAAAYTALAGLAATAGLHVPVVVHDLHTVDQAWREQAAAPGKKVLLRL